MALGTQKTWVLYRSMNSKFNNGSCETAARSDTDRTRLKRAVKTTDRRIDALVYELYGLTEEEIRVVEGDVL
jgi:hypothetical protein